ncbi:MAG: hypothetical protein ABIH79_02320 [archaeon]
MKISELIDELKETETYRKFKEENPSTFFSAGFLVLDLESKSEKIQLDFFLSKQNKMASFEYPFEKPKIYEDEIKEMLPQTTMIKVDIDDLEKLSKEIIIKNNSKMIPTRIIAILQKNIWNLTCMDNFLGSIRIKLDAITGEQISFSQGNLIGMMQPKK